MSKVAYRGYRFPPEIIQRAVWLYYRFTLSFRDVEELLAERAIEVTYDPTMGHPLRAGNRSGSPIAPVPTARTVALGRDVCLDLWEVDVSVASR
jgi:hypothetical protein